jgi:nucleoside-diphosphate-sugar epimerase
MRVLITGANGFIGSALTHRMFQRGDAVRVLLRPGADTSLLAGLPLAPAAAVNDDAEHVCAFEGELLRAGSFDAALRDVDVVVHLAGLRRSPSRQELFAVNAEGTRAVCEAMVRCAPNARLVLCSSLTAMGPSRDFPNERAPLKPADWYGESKALAEEIALSFADRLHVGIARPSRIVGPGDRENLFFFRLVERGLRFTIGGAPRPMSTLDVDDLTDGLCRLAERDGPSGEIFCLSRDTTTQEALIEEIARQMGCRTFRVHLPERLLKVVAAGADAVTRLTGRRLPINRKLAQQLLAPGWTCSIVKARERLGFDPKIPLAESVARSLDWYRAKAWLKSAASDDSGSASTPRPSISSSPSS